MQNRNALAPPIHLKTDEKKKNSLNSRPLPITNPYTPTPSPKGNVDETDSFDYIKNNVKNKQEKYLCVKN